MCKLQKIANYKVADFAESTVQQSNEIKVKYILEKRKRQYLSRH